MKKNVLSCVLSTLILYGLPSVVGAATLINVNKLSVPKTDCNPNETTGYTYYLPDDGYYTHPADDFRVKGGDALILKDWSSVDIWRGKGTNVRVLDKCDNWQRISNVVKNWDKVVAFRVAEKGSYADKCVFNIPDYTKNEETAENIDAQIHFSIWWWKIGNEWTETNSPLYYVHRGESNYRCYPNWSWVSDSNYCNKYKVKYNKVNDPHVWECQNYTLFRCGDGLVNGRKNWQKITVYDNGTYVEECDPEASEWKNRSDWKSCSNSCKIIEPEDPICGSIYNKTTKYTPTSGFWLTRETANLCDTWNLDKFTYEGTPRVYAWTCKNGYKETSPSCTAKQMWCGDWELNGEEKCDDGEKNGTSESSCSKECTTVGSVECGSLGWDTKYFLAQQTTPWYTKSSTWMCPDGLVVGTPYITWADFHEEWTCSNTNGTQKTCKAYQEYCGDGKKNGGEQCDYNDSLEKWGTEEWWGNDWCDISCNQKNEVVSSCTVENTFHYKLRQNYKYTFWDIFDARDADRRLFWDPEVIFIEQKDFNRWENPTFRWTNRNSEKKVSMNTSEKILESTPEYHILDVPDIRTGNNLYIEYSIKYANSRTAPEYRRKTHKECVFYEISWCGDGEVDKDWDGKKNDEPWEECDPEAEPWKTNHRCDPVTCKEKEPVIGYPDIKKTLKGKDKIVVSGTWQTLEWYVKVTALSWDVEDFEIQDIVPFALEYIGYDVVKNPNETGLSVNNPTKDDPVETGNVYTWNVRWTLYSGEELLLKVNTKVIEMPTSDDDYRNVACVIQNKITLDCDDDKPLKPDLRIKKYILSGNQEVKTWTVQIWDKITYKIYFGNSGGAAATITSIKDFLPKNVKYVSSEIHMTKTTTDHTHTSSTQTENREFKWFNIVDGMYIDIFGGLTLEPWDKGYIILTGEILDSNKDNTTNFACIYLNNKVIDCDDATHYIDEPISCSKEGFTITTTSFSNQWWSTNVSCSTYPKWRTGTIVIDCWSWSTGTRYYTWEKVSSLTWICSYPWNTSSSAVEHGVECRVNNVRSDDCAWKISVAGHDEDHSGDDPYCQAPVQEKDGTFTCTSTDKVYAIGIDCDHKAQVVKDIDKEIDAVSEAKDGREQLTVSAKCNASNDVQCYVKNNRSSSWKTKANDCSWKPKIIPNPPDRKTPYCDSLDENSNGKYLVCTASSNAYFKVTCDGVDMNDIDTSRNKSIKIPYNRYKTCAEVKCYVSNEKIGKWPSSCIRRNENPQEAKTQTCFNVNAWNFSIEEGEILPFYWNMKNINFTGNKNAYTDIPDVNYKTAPTNYSTYKNQPCNEEWKIAKNSMVCVFNIYDGSGYHKGRINGIDINKPLYTIEWPCLSSDPVINTKAKKEKNLIDVRYENMRNTYCNNPGNSNDCVFYYGDGKGDNHPVLPTAVYYIKDFWTESAWVHLNAWVWEWGLYKELDSANKKSFWEYRIELSDVRYLACEGGIWEEKEALDDLNFEPCQNAFMLTNAYTVQKTPSGNLTASVKELKKYRDYMHNQTFDKLLNAIDATDYKPNTEVNKKMDEFIKKYEKLAVSVKLTDKSFLYWADIKKVPWKSIYFVSGSVIINWNKAIATPFTIVQTKWNATISGNVNQNNMMLLTRWNIIFSWDCTYDQTVKWIFYASGNINRNNFSKNTEVGNTVWCKNGWLHIKGVLIGNGFDNLMKWSRSNLNDWLNANKWSEADIQNQRRKYVMDWASVVIEYSPSIFNKSTMPPGAEDFTTALSIYKQ